MAFDQKKLAKPLDKLRRIVKNLPVQPSPDTVHQLRTQSRRAEAVASALKLEQHRPVQRLLKQIAPLRKLAGKVRDMDVLTGFAATLVTSDESENQVELLLALGDERRRAAKRLHLSARREEKQFLRNLKKSRRLLRNWIEIHRENNCGDLSGGDPAGLVIALSGCLSSWATFDEGNLHAFRLSIKELRYALELGQHSDDRLLDALRTAKDAIGEWHDWNELLAFAGKTVGPSNLLKQIDTITEQRFRNALQIATNLQRKYFAAARPGDKSHKGVMRMPTPVLISAANMTD